MDRNHPLKPFLYVSSVDYTITLNRPCVKGVWSSVELDSVLNLSGNDQMAERELEDFCLNGPPNIVAVVPRLSDVTYRHMLAVIKILNPAYTREKNYMHNGKWERLILGSDIRNRVRDKYIRSNRY